MVELTLRQPLFPEESIPSTHKIRGSAGDTVRLDALVVKGKILTILLETQPRSSVSQLSPSRTAFINYLSSEIFGATYKILFFSVFKD